MNCIQNASASARPNQASHQLHNSNEILFFDATLTSLKADGWKDKAKYGEAPADDADA